MVTTTPTTWLGEYIVNAGNDSGEQFQPQLTQLNNGNILVAWVDDTNNVDTGGREDIIGQILDPLGLPLGDPFWMNPYNAGNDSGRIEVAALGDGGFVLVYEDYSGSGYSGFGSIRAIEFDASGTVVAFQTMESGGGGFPLVRDPSVTVAANGTYLVAWQREIGGDVYSRVSLVDPASSTISATSSILLSSNVDTTGLTQNNSVAALNNGTFVLVTRSPDANEGIVGRIVGADGTSDGATMGAFWVSDTLVGRSRFGVDVTALNGGGFVAAWSEDDGTDTDIIAQRFDNSGNMVGGQIFVNIIGLTQDNTELSLSSLSDGGFVIVYDNNDDNTISGQRFDATGTAVGSEFTVSSIANAGSPEVIGLDDGRIAVTWQSTPLGSTADIEFAILDTRDDFNTTPSYSPDSWQIGTIYDDVLIMPETGAGDVVHGWIGDDEIIGNSQANILFGGLGNDVLDGGSSDPSVIDVMYGGVGNDSYFVNSTASFLDIVYEGGTVSGGAADVDTIVSTGTFFWDFYDVGEVLVIGATAPNHAQMVSGRGNSTMWGNDTDNTLLAYGGQNYILPGAGTDTIGLGLYGLGAGFNGVNTVKLNPGDDVNYIYDFESGIDIVDTSGYGRFANGAEMLANVVDTGWGSFVWMGVHGGQDEYVAFVDTYKADLVAGDFFTIT